MSFANISIADHCDSQAGQSELPQRRSARITSCRVRGRRSSAPLGRTFGPAHCVRMYFFRAPAN